MELASCCCLSIDGLLCLDLRRGSFCLVGIGKGEFIYRFFTFLIAYNCFQFSSLFVICYCYGCCVDCFVCFVSIRQVFLYLSHLILISSGFVICQVCKGDLSIYVCHILGFILVAICLWCQRKVELASCCCFSIDGLLCLDLRCRSFCLVGIGKGEFIYRFFTFLIAYNCFQFSSLFVICYCYGCCVDCFVCFVSIRQVFLYLSHLILISSGFVICQVCKGDLSIYVCHILGFILVAICLWCQRKVELASCCCFSIDGLLCLDLGCCRFWCIRICKLNFTLCSTIKCNRFRCNI